jgi:hypothetical protein
MFPFAAAPCGFCRRAALCVNAYHYRIEMRIRVYVYGKQLENIGGRRQLTKDLAR